jgi:hypothetical protein
MRFIEQGNRGQDAVTVQTAGIKPVRHEIGGSDKTHTVIEQRHQQAVQDHGIGDVGNVEFVETDELVTFGNARTQHIERVLRALQLVEFAVHFAHELMKVQAHLALERHGIEEAIHEKALAAPYPAIHVNALGNLGAVDEFLQCVGAPSLVDSPLFGTALQCLDGAQLRRITFKSFERKLCLISLTNGDGHANPNAIK